MEKGKNNMKKIIIPVDSRFALVGHGYHLFHLYNEFVKNKLPNPIIITHEKKFTLLVSEKIWWH